MPRSFEIPMHAFFRFAMSLVLLFGLAACASKSYVVLLPDASGAVGQVIVSNAAGSTVLKSANEAALVGGEAGKTFPVDQDRLAKDFGVAMAASPQTPRSFLLYFEAGGTALTAESHDTIPEIVSEIKQRAGADISVIGHTDTAGDADANYRLGLKRAEIVAELISDTGVQHDRMVIESHGKKNLIVPTPDNTDEPRNRRVEVTVR
jgi:outer membrane protein OmpA-like peptidoglycan-associated protein